MTPMQGPSLHIGVVTLFPELFGPFLDTSIVGRAIRSLTLEVAFEPLRDHGLGRHRSVDDTPYGGGSGMVLRVDCVVAAMESAEGTRGRAHRVLLTPQGAPLMQRTVETLVGRRNFVLVCGRYEGFDERVRAFVDEEISLGDFVLAGGEVAAMAVIEACARLLPGVLGNIESIREESFSAAQRGLLEYPQYTRPLTFRGHTVPEVLCSGNHEKIQEFRREAAQVRTRERRPDLMAPYGAPRS
jgi:tRNA (guanine37-N1)-methyltransferase